ncbi:MAG TPA: hypothetical protein VGM93_12675, partial [Acidimicrobiales bacterium]
ASDRLSRLHAVVTGTFAFVAAEGDAWGVLASSGGFDHPALHQLRSRWVAAVSVDDDPGDAVAQAVVAGLVLGAGGWIARGVEPTDLLPGLRRALQIGASG